MTKSFSGPVSELLPHRPPMLLIDALLEDSPEHVRVSALVRREALFVTEEGWPGWVGAELMAQSIGVWGGLLRLSRGEAVQVGFLLGSRRYECRVPFFPVGARLEINAVQEIVSEQGLAVFNCTLFMDGEPVATANLNVFQPPDVSAYLKELM